MFHKHLQDGFIPLLPYRYILPETVPFLIIFLYIYK